MDPADAFLWVCGWAYQHVGFPDVVENFVGHGQGDDCEFVEVQVVSGGGIREGGGRRFVDWLEI